MSFIPGRILSKLFNRTSLHNAGDKVCFSVKNRLAPATLLGVSRIEVDGAEVPVKQINVSYDDDPSMPLRKISANKPLDFPLGRVLTFFMDTEPLDPGKHDVTVVFNTEPFGELRMSVCDELNTGERAPGTLPRDPENDYDKDIIKARQKFIREQSGVKLDHVTRYSIDPNVTRGNIEHFTGAAQVPLGFAGPLLVNGQHAQGEFFIPLATSEGTLVASYNRGMKVLHECGGVKCAVVGDNMQRAPVFIFEDAATARRFADWVVENTDGIREVTEATDPFVKLKYVDYYLANKFAFLRFNYRTGDAAGMNMVGKATFAACNWILQNCESADIKQFYLESNFATDKKASVINIMRTRGKRVTAEATIKRDVLMEIMDADTEALHQMYGASNIGTLMSGANNNGLHSANAITAMFLATGQDVANVSESSVALLYAELTPEKDLYFSITLPSLIVATCGGGTGLPTQRECLEVMDCFGIGKVYKFAEIVAGTVLAGEISLASAIASLDWVSSHDQLGRNDPTRT
ncbi:MAG: hydroxymethylglutaryl-CoA reductase [Xanthomonadales bacterium]|nr:hydroxymethylglutaryl-CoA reductase [Gammaproteobacteria bacterium]MBT8055575.1 hydroxymethylglutaryl-CoA reductase [Gammaproteobacteria bacterium]NNJ78431.1 hydroxymethylglutaryl-CoA reductase [Xanthomonadales bacterium]NNL03820.1 hydroxymethylglutaryl-CoA reductase [Xanthomonadales bacterium]